MSMPSAAMTSPGLSAAIAAGGALLGVLVGAGISLFRGRVERRRRQGATVGNFRRELRANRRSCSSNLMLLKTEDVDLKEGCGLGHTNALNRMLDGAWTLVFLDLPSSLASDAALLSEIETLLAVSRRINGDLEARERFHLQHLMAERRSLVDGLSRFANVLIYPQEDLIRRIDRVDALLEDQPGTVR